MRAAAAKGVTSRTTTGGRCADGSSASASASASHSAESMTSMGSRAWISATLTIALIDQLMLRAKPSAAPMTCTALSSVNCTRMSPWANQRSSSSGTTTVTI